MIYNLFRVLLFIVLDTNMYYEIVKICKKNINDRIWRCNMIYCNHIEE